VESSRAYVGKDLLRWIDQCLECVARDPDLRQKDIRYQSFAAFLVNHAPEPVQAKLRRWGVSDYRAIFTPALALSVLFADAPDRSSLSNEFIRNYYRLCRSNLRVPAEPGEIHQY